MILRNFNSFRTMETTLPRLILIFQRISSIVVHRSCSIGYPTASTFAGVTLVSERRECDAFWTYRRPLENGLCLLNTWLLDNVSFLNHSRNLCKILVNFVQPTFRNLIIMHRATEDGTVFPLIELYSEEMVNRAPHGVERL